MKPDIRSSTALWLFITLCLAGFGCTTNVPSGQCGACPQGTACGDDGQCHSLCAKSSDCGSVCDTCKDSLCVSIEGCTGQLVGPPASITGATGTVHQSSSPNFVLRGGLSAAAGTAASTGFVLYSTP